MASTIELERQRAHEVAEEYRRKGYEVIEEPASTQLPEFLSGYQPNILARKGREAVIVEVRARSSLDKNPQISHLARLLRGRIGWNFELVVVGESGILDLPGGSQLVGKPFIPERVAASDSLIKGGHSEAAFLLAWATLESTIRLLLEDEDSSLGPLDAEHLLNQAVASGVISRDDYSTLTQMRRYRNAVVHGFETPDFNFSDGYSIIKSTIEGLLQPEADTWRQDPAGDSDASSTL